MLFDPSAIAAFIQAVVTGFSVLAGFMAAESGLRAALAQIAGAPNSRIGEEINAGIAWGFRYGAPAAVVVFTGTLVIL